MGTHAHTVAKTTVQFSDALTSIHRIDFPHTLLCNRNIPGTPMLQRSHGCIISE